MREARNEACAYIAARGNASKIRFLEFSSVEFRRDEVTALASADAESFIYPSAKMPSARCRALASRMMKPHKTPLLLQFLSLGVVEAASSSLVTQTRKREMSNLPFFQFLWDFFEA